MHRYAAVCRVAAFWGVSARSGLGVVGVPEVVSAHTLIVEAFINEHCRSITTEHGRTMCRQRGRQQPRRPPASVSVSGAAQVDRTSNSMESATGICAASKVTNRIGRGRRSAAARCNASLSRSG